MNSADKTLDFIVLMVVSITFQTAVIVLRWLQTAPSGTQRASEQPSHMVATT